MRSSAATAVSVKCAPLLFRCSIQEHRVAAGAYYVGAYVGIGRKNGVLWRVFRLLAQGGEREPIFEYRALGLLVLQQ